MSVIPQMPAPSSALDPKSREPAAAPAPACPGEVSWDYDRAEIIADGAVHATGIVLGLAGAVAIVIAAIKMDRVGIAPVVIYIIGLVTMLALSALYNMWPISPTKWVLRRFDHSAIYLLIAGTYTPFLAQLKLGIISMGLGIGVWASAVIGMVLKLALPGRFDRLAVVLFLLLGWSGAIVYEFVRIRPPDFEPMAARDRRHSLLGRRTLSWLARPALSQRDLAWLRTAGGKLPLFGRSHVPGVGMTSAVNLKFLSVSQRVRLGTSNSKPH